MVKKEKQSKQDIAQATSEKLLELMGVAAKVEVKEDSENEALVIDISSENSLSLWSQYEQ